MLLNDVGPYDDINEIIEYKAIESTAMKDSFWHHSIIVPSHGSGGPLLLENLKHVNESLPPLVSAIDAFKCKSVFLFFSTYVFLLFICFIAIILQIIILQVYFILIQ